MTTDDDIHEIENDDIYEIVRRARSAFSAGKPSVACSLIYDEATRLKKEGKSALANELYREALEQVSVDLAALLDLSDEFPQIPKLDLQRRGVLDKHMPFLCKLKSIKELDLGFNDITDVGMADLPKLTSLEYLSLRNNTTISDGGVKQLAALTSLIKLDLRDTRLSDRGLDYLLGLTSLKRVYASHTSVTAVGADDFRKKRQDVTVHL